jgi:MoaA/NifB/PqqE/SkfB family radical SAM enzyme
MSLDLPAELAWMRPYPMDGALLLFDRESGTNVLCEGAETAHLCQKAPRVVQFAITNKCNLACSFCSRDLDAASDWTLDNAVQFLADLADAGVLEVAFGGGEPWSFPHFPELVRRLYDQTPLAVNFTTNGLAMTLSRLRAIQGCYGQCRLSLYDNNNWERRVAMLADAGARFGVNYLVTPHRLARFEAVVLRLVALGCRDVLLLSYNGSAAELHLSDEQNRDLKERVRQLGRALIGHAVLKLDVCWGERLDTVPRLFHKSDCGAGLDFIVITSDRQVMPCSFHQVGFRVTSANDVMDVWQNRRDQLRGPSVIPGCARAPGYGLRPSK